MNQTRLGIKPVFVGVIGLPEKEWKWFDEVQKQNDEIAREIEQSLSGEARLLPFAVIDKQEDLEKLAADLHETDVYLICWKSGLAVRLATQIGMMYRKPVMSVGKYTPNRDLMAYLRSRGLEAHAPLDYSELRDLVSILWARKAIRSTRMLLVTSTKLPPAKCDQQRV